MSVRSVGLSPAARRSAISPEASAARPPRKSACSIAWNRGRSGVPGIERSRDASAAAEEASPAASRLLSSTAWVRLSARGPKASSSASARSVRPAAARSAISAAPWLGLDRPPAACSAPITSSASSSRPARRRAAASASHAGACGARPYAQLATTTSRASSHSPAARSSSTRAVGSNLVGRCRCSVSSAERSAAPSRAAALSLGLLLRAPTCARKRSCAVSDTGVGAMGRAQC
eukprot:scaffold10177_cov96-Isochrysis_galbana.AAC.1